jgi:hypothetical protein
VHLAALQDSQEDDMTRAVTAVLGSALLSGVSLLGHHSYEAFHTDRKIPVEGTIVRLLVENPHVLLNVKTADGAVYVAEWGPPNQLRRAGMRWNMLELGDTVAVSGSPMKDPAQHRLALLTEVRDVSKRWRWVKQGNRILRDRQAD